MFLCLYLLLNIITYKSISFLGVIGIAEPAAAQETLEMLAAFSVPLVIASPQLAEAVSDDSTILSTSPDLKSLINVRKMYSLSLKYIYILLVKAELYVDSLILFNNRSYWL